MVDVEVDGPVSVDLGVLAMMSWECFGLLSIGQGAAGVSARGWAAEWAAGGASAHAEESISVWKLAVVG